MGSRQNSHPAFAPTVCDISQREYWDVQARDIATVIDKVEQSIF
ncbi:MAG: hypothetical protein AAFY17_10630 [Cyanobacteria bacterium J06642_11]